MGSSVSDAVMTRSNPNKTVAGMLLTICVPLFYMVGQPGKIAERELDNNSAGPFANDNPAEYLKKAQGGIPDGHQEKRNQWDGILARV